MTALALWTMTGFGVGASLTPTTWLLMHRKTRGLRLVGATAVLTAIAFSLIASDNPDLSTLLASSAVAAVGIQLAAIDLVEQRLPRELIWALLAATISVLTLSAAVSGESGRLITAVAATCISVGFHYGLALASRGGIGAGDVRLAAPLGCLLAWQSWQVLFAGVLISFAGTAIVAVIAKATHHRRTSLPHGPSMMVGTVIAFLL